MNTTISLLKQLDGYHKLYEAAADNKSVAVFGVDVHKAYFSALLSDHSNRKAFIIVSDDSQARQVREIMEAECGKSLIFPSKEYNFRNVESVSRFDENKRIETLSAIRKNDFSSVIIPANALCSLVLHPSDFKEFEIYNGDIVKFDEIPDNLVKMGYEFFPTVEGAGQFSVRGGIVDVFPPSEETPYRIEFYGDEVDSISVFDINTQRRTEIKDSVRITPAQESVDFAVERLKAMLDPIKNNKFTVKDYELLEQGIIPAHDRYFPAKFNKKANILNYLRNDDLLFIFDWQSVYTHINKFCQRITDDIKQLSEEGYAFLNSDYFVDIKWIENHIKNPVIFETLPCTVRDIPIDAIIDIKLFQTSITSFMTLKNEIDEYLATDNHVYILSNDIRHADELKKSFVSQNNLSVTTGTIPFGFYSPELKTVVYTYRNLHGSSDTRIKRSKYERGERIKSFSDIKQGDYVVHTNYGIGIYDGIHKVESQGVIKDYIKVKYAGTDVLYIPCDHLDQISKYIGSDSDVKVKLNKLGSADWQRTRQKVKKAVRDLAKKLIDLYGQRSKIKGYSFSPDNEWQRDFEACFEFEETDDQLRCSDEIKKDMESSKPMDRLLCGDVGFGKTEVAMRAVFKCVMDAKQAVILAPTTILAFQHYNTILKRFYGYPITIELLSRFRTSKQQEEIISRLKKGQIDVIVGTHRLVQKDVAFKNLGLVVIDEEQRFGVAHKEYLKEMCPGVDFLSLSATPIPRTLNMSLSGIRDISILNEAPNNRFPVTTYVAEYDIGMVTDAIKREISRGGQCFYLHNRIETIYKTASLLEEKTNARIQVAHGKMSKEELSKIWEELTLGNIDVLVCTTIIETGVDVPNCNTLIIEDADRMGLAQLHQIRGRVGRTNRRAYAFFLFRKGKTLSSDAYKRLMTIREYNEFGSGLKIAMRDLEIRGAGNILGAEQSGHLLTVGFDMYMKLLEDAVSEEKGEGSIKRDCSIDIKIDAYIPDDYIYNSDTRIEVYKMISCIENEDDYSDVLDELIDRFGEPPKQVINLMDIAKIRFQSAEKGLSEIKESNGRLLIFSYNDPPIEKIPELTAAFRGRLLFSAGAKPYFTLRSESYIKDMELFLDNL
ncbi:MAG: transcription-repair coupling factor [Clostridia bacterium]|nr:transcription-repair coupling factor [Clostridia bacterium]